MEYRVDSGVIVVKLEPGDAVISSLAALAREQRLDGGSLQGIGAVNQARLGFYRPEEKRYQTRELRENLEVVSLTGNLGHVGEEPMVHAHAVLGRSDYSLVGGHLFEACVSVTLEIFIRPTDNAILRTHDPRFDLNLMRLLRT